MPTPLLLLSCSARKRRDGGELPALERYDGPAFRVLRRFGRQFPATLVETWIVSARFGLLQGQTPVPLYDQRLGLTPDKAWSNALQTALNDALGERPWGRFLWMPARVTARLWAPSSRFCPPQTPPWLRCNGRAARRECARRARNARGAIARLARTSRARRPSKYARRRALCFEWDAPSGEVSRRHCARRSRATARSGRALARCAARFNRPSVSLERRHFAACWQNAKRLNWQTT